MSFQLFGSPVSRGIAIGRAVLVASSRLDVAHYYVAPEDVDAEIDRLRGGRNAVVRELATLKRELPADAPAELSALLDVHLMLLQDDALTGAARQWIRERHYNAEWALSAQLEVLARQFDEMEDEYVRERKADLEQVVERLIGVLARGADGASTLASHAVAPEQSGDDPLVLVAADISPADMLRFKGGVFLGFVTDVGGKTSHTAIVARSMDIPAVVGAREASRLIRQDDWVVIDGDAGVVIVDPAPAAIEEYRGLKRKREAGRARLARLRHLPAVTRDGERVELLANIEQPEDAAAALAAGAAGVGLFRSEFLFMTRAGELPGEDEQYEAYRTAVQAMRGRPVTIRTVDIGADKELDRMSANELRHEHVLNPALGLRAIRWSLSEPAMFRQQLEDAGRAYGAVELGAMVEIPAAALMLPRFLRYFEFVSIGTNDLIQYTLAIDRADEAVAHLYDPWHPAVLQLVAQTVACARRMRKDVSVCGEMAGDPAFTEPLLGMGLRSFSMHPSQLLTVKERVLGTDASRWARALDRVRGADDPEREVAMLASEISAPRGGPLVAAASSL
jgi:phosphotransferase system enzyme I (PtsI)